MENKTCRTCGIAYAVPEEFDAGRKVSGEWWYCPNGHQWKYTETEETRLRNMLVTERRSAARAWDRLNCERLSHRATRGHLTRHRNRSDGQK